MSLILKGIDSLQQRTTVANLVDAWKTPLELAGFGWPAKFGGLFETTRTGTQMPVAKKRSYEVRFL